MTQRHGPAVDVDLFAIEIEFANEPLRHNREGFVDFPHVDIVFAEPGLHQDFLRRWYRRIQHQRGAIAHVGGCHNSRPGRHAAFFHIGLGGE